MDQEALDQIWRDADRERGHRPIDLAYAISAARARGPLTWRDVAGLAVRDRSSEVSRPLFLLEFVAGLTAALAPRSILDPWVTAPTMLAAAHDATGSDYSCGLVRDTQLYEISQSLGSIDWRHGDPLRLLDDVDDEQFDLLLLSPPIGVRVEDSQRADDPPAKRTELADLVLWRAVRHLGASGHLLFQTSDNFLWAESRQWLAESLGRQGLHLKAVVSVDGGLAPLTSISTSLVLFGRDVLTDLFVGRLDRRTPIPRLVANLIAARGAGDPQLGILTSSATFRGWRSFVIERELAEQFGSRQMRRLGDLGGVRTVHLRPDRPYKAPPNCVFVPGLGFGPVTTSPPDLGLKRIYTLAELQLDPAIARAEYVAALLSSPVGKRLRESIATGSTIPHITGPALGTLRIPVPSIAVQEEAIRTAAHLASMEATVSRLRSDLWRHPEGALGLLTRLASEAKADPVRRWTESLPYPLASVLQRYIAQRDADLRVEGLLHFFEVTAQFGCAVLISILRAVPDLLHATQPDIARAAPPGRALFTRADFGLWINLGRTLAKAFRRLAEDLDQRDRLAGAAEPSGELMARYADKAIWHVLDSAREIRNQRAHGGVVSQQQVNSWLGALETHLSQAEQALANGFEEVDLVRAAEGRYRAGVYTQCHLAYFDHAAALIFSLLRTGLASLMAGGASWRVPCWPGFLTG